VDGSSARNGDCLDGDRTSWPLRRRTAQETRSIAFDAALLLASALGLVVCWRRCAVLGGVCATCASGCAALALAGGPGEAAIGSVALLALGGAVTIVGEMVWRRLADEDGGAVTDRGAGTPSPGGGTPPQHEPIDEVP